jgi:hypothetical protein
MGLQSIVLCIGMAPVKTAELCELENLNSFTTSADAARGTARYLPFINQYRDRRHHKLLPNCVLQFPGGHRISTVLISFKLCLILFLSRLCRLRITKPCNVDVGGY